MEQKRKKLSGSQYKKKRLKNEEQGRKLSNVMKKFLVQKCGLDEPSTSAATDLANNNTVPPQSLPEEVVEESQILTPSDLHEQPGSTSTSTATALDLANKNTVPPQSIPEKIVEEIQKITSSEVHQEPGRISSGSQQVLKEIPSDPALWLTFCMSSQTRQLLVERGPHQIKELEFPINKGKRRFLPSYYSKVLSNGEAVEISWLIYSIASDAGFCFCCILFDNSADWSKKGYSDWKNLIRALAMHEKSVNHRNAFRAWKELDIRLKQKKTIDAEYQLIMGMELQHWRGVIKRIMSIIKLLVSQCLAFRGSTEHLFQPNNGNFLKLVELLSEFDPVMEEHISRVQRESDKWSVTYLSNNIQDELINLMGNSILRKIVEITKIAKFFSIIADCTPDVSHYEQLSLTIRVVTFNSIQNKYEIAEFFISFFEASDSTGEGLAKLILTHLKKLGFELKWLRRQGYDNGANMKGVRKGVQNRILEKYPRAFYVPCACHSLNLVVNDAASSTTETTFFFSIVQELYTIFSGSTKRWEVLQKYVSQLTLKPLSVTRWASRIDALKPLRFQLCEIYDALILIIEDVNRDAETKVKARGLAKNIKNYKFICGVILWHDILFEINSVLKLLQSVTINISDCVRMLSETIKKVKSYRQSGYIQMKIAAKEIAENLKCSTEFPDDTEVRPRRKKRQFDYEKAVDEPLTEEKKFKINFFNYILDITLNSLNERFTLLETHSKKFHLEFILSVENETDINANDLREELRDVSRMLPYSTKPLDVLNYLSQNSLISLYPNTVVTLRILLTLPVSVASGERSFSKLKLIKNYLRSSIGQTKHKNLALISIESAMASTLDYTSVINEFAKVKVRRVKL
ncbi:zinc finger MYM-type protein 1-like [Hydra vulgaris]|uniref:zinc finger MYM-type protein 1-like n=1 Tax=Hydra vulgaris TaxID=6087 RepID=UPI0032EA50B6